MLDLDCVKESSFLPLITEYPYLNLASFALHVTLSVSVLTQPLGLFVRQGASTATMATGYHFLGGLPSLFHIKALYQATVMTTSTIGPSLCNGHVGQVTLFGYTLFR